MHGNPATGRDAGQRMVPPLGAGRLSMTVFLVSLGVFFVAGLLIYAYIRYGGPRVPPAGTIAVPRSLWASTAVLLLSGTALEAAHRAVRRERQRAFRAWLLIALGLAFAFLAVQVPALWQYLSAQAAAQGLARGAGEIGPDWHVDYVDAIERNAGPREAQVYMIVAVLVGLHALHLVGGILPLGIVAVRACGGRYDHEYHRGVTACAWYWHFLDAVWLVLLAAFHLMA